LEFFIDIILPAELWPGVDTASNRNKYQNTSGGGGGGGKGGRWVGLTTLGPSCADCLEIWEPQVPGTLRAVQACTGIALPVLSVTSGFIICDNCKNTVLTRDEVTSSKCSLTPIALPSYSLD